MGGRFEKDLADYKGKVGTGFLYRIEKDGAVHFLMATVQAAEDKFYKTNLSAPLRQLVEREKIQKLYIQALPPSMSGEDFPEELYTMNLELALLEDFSDLEFPPSGLETLHDFMESCGLSQEQVASLRKNKGKLPKPATDWEYLSGNEHAAFLKWFAFTHLPPSQRKLMKSLFAKMFKTIVRGSIRSQDSIYPCLDVSSL